MASIKELSGHKGSGSKHRDCKDSGQECEKKLSHCSNQEVNGSGWSKYTQSEGKTNSVIIMEINRSIVVVLQGMQLPSAVTKKQKA